jgi:hypothetical protein
METYEIHITVKSDSFYAFKVTCSKLKRVKPILIKLPYGQTPTQLMTSSHIRTDLDGVYREMKHQIEFLKDDGYEVIRSKIELKIPCKQKIDPQPHQYFEFHYKILLPNHLEKLRLMEVTKKLNVHVSRSAFGKPAKGGAFFNFVTLRLFNVTKENAILESKKIHDKLTKKKFEIVSTEKEFAIYDSNTALDTGWIYKSS